MDLIVNIVIWRVLEEIAQSFANKIERAGSLFARRKLSYARIFPSNQEKIIWTCRAIGNNVRCNQLMSSLDKF